MNEKGYLNVLENDSSLTCSSANVESITENATEPTVVSHGVLVVTSSPEFYIPRGLKAFKKGKESYLGQMESSGVNEFSTFGFLIPVKN